MTPKKRTKRARARTRTPTWGNEAAPGVRRVVEEGSTPDYRPRQALPRQRAGVLPASAPQVCIVRLYPFRRGRSHRRRRIKRCT
jgi:hypothetical protein